MTYELNSVLFVNLDIVTRNDISGDMGRKIPISFNLQKYVEKHCNGSKWVHTKTRWWLKSTQNADWKK